MGFLKLSRDSQGVNHPHRMIHVARDCRLQFKSRTVVEGLDDIHLRWLNHDHIKRNLRDGIPIHF
ncbi:hypothetical protein D3C86_1919960 [compost metagenome]